MVQAWPPDSVGRRILALCRVVILLSLCPLALGAQASLSEGPGRVDHGLFGPSGLSVGLGARFHHQADDLVSPLRYHGFAFGTSLQAGFSDWAWVRSLDLSLERPRLTSRATEGRSHSQEGWRVDLSLVGLHRIAGLFDGRLSLLFGGAAAGHFASYDQWYTAQSKEGWIHLFGFLEPGVGWRAALPWGGLLWQELMVPLLGVAYRPEYQGLTEQPGPTWLGFGDVGGVEQGLHYLQPLGERVRLGLTYTFVGFRYEKPRPLAWTRHGLALRVTVWDGRFLWR